MNSKQTGPEIESLSPLGLDSRIFNLTSYTLMLWASMIVIHGFVVGQTLLPPHGKLNLLQGIIVILITGSLIGTLMALNGHAGFKYGIPFCIQVRSTFGIRGAKIPEFLRIFPALIWYGIGTWLAVLAMDAIVQTLTGFGPPAAKYGYFVFLQAIQTWLAYTGVKTMKVFNVSISLVLVLIMGYFLYNALQTKGALINQFWYTEGSWGLAFWGGISTALGGMIAVISSASDLTRYIQPGQRNLWIGNLLGMIPPLFFMMFLGIVAAITTNLWDPIQALIALSPGVPLMLMLMLFIFAAQFSTNLTLNILPSALVLEEMFGISWHKGVVLTGILGTLTFPWIILESGENFTTFINYITCLYGPIVGCMLADYHKRKRKLALEQFYIEDNTGSYWYRDGINWAAVSASILSAVVTMIWALKLSALLGVPLGYISYIVLSRLFNRDDRTPNPVQSQEIRQS